MSQAISVHDRWGHPVGWVSDNVVHDLAGRAVAVLRGPAIHAFSGRLLGVLDNGVVRDVAGGAIAFLPGATADHPLPVPHVAPAVPTLEMLPGAAFASVGHALPTRGARAGWSRLDWKQFLAGAEP